MATLFSVGDVLQGYGLHNAGRFYTVVHIPASGKEGRITVEEHITGRKFKTWCAWMRLA